MMPCPLLQQNALFCCICVFATVIVVLTHGTQGHDNIQRPSIQPHHQQQQQSQQQQQQQNIHQQHVNSAHQSHASHNNHHHGGSGGHNVESRSSYAMLSQAMSQAVSHEFSGTGSGSADGACVADDIECLENVHDRLGMEAIKSLHQQLDDDDNGNIDLTESDDFLREELKYDSGYEKRHKTFHYNDDTQISVKELWEAWLRSEVHNWTVEQTTDWLSQSVQLPQYVELFQKHKVSGETLPRLAVHNMHYVSTVLGIRDPIHKQKIALKAMDVVLFGPPRETGTRWKDYFLVTLLLSAIIGCWYAYQQNKNAKRHLRRMVKDMEGLQRAENALTEMQKELELARLEQENVATEKLDLERRLKEAPSLSSSNSDLELQQLKQEIEMLRAELSRAEVELVDHCWTPPPALQSWLQLTYELESKHTLKKRVMAEKQLQLAREACEKLKRKRSSLVGAFVSTHGKSIDDVDRSIVEARNALSEVTTELQERLQRWKQIESLLGFNIVNNNGLAYLENVLYNRNGSAKSSRNRMSGSQDELDDESVQGGRVYRDDSSGSDDGEVVTFIVGSEPSSLRLSSVPIPTTASSPMSYPASHSSLTSLAAQNSSHPMSTSIIESSPSVQDDNIRASPLAMNQDKVVIPLPRTKKSPATSQTSLVKSVPPPMPPPRRVNSHLSFTFNSLNRAQSSDVEPLESTASSIVSSTTSAHGDTQPEDTYSTDSSSFDGEFKKRRRKLHFPFGKKSHKSKNA